ncbi:MAG: DNRLRE domain-containing protein [Parafilimonas sp.]
MKKIYSALLVSAVFFITATSCNKTQDAVPLSNPSDQPSAEQIIASENGVATATSSRNGDNVTLTLRPAKLNGQDAMILKYDPDPNYANTNKGQEVDIPALTWTAGGIPTYRRSLICFNQLSFIPPGATIVSAKLYLYGLPSGGSPNCPQGNSSGSGYQDNKSWLQMCAQPWTESTVTWNNQPSLTGSQIQINTTTSQWGASETIDIKTFVQNWIVSANNGMMMYLQNENPYTSITFGASENSTAYRPKLVVVYHI